MKTVEVKTARTVLFLLGISIMILVLSNQLRSIVIQVEFQHADNNHITSGSARPEVVDLGQNGDHLPREVDKIEIMDNDLLFNVDMENEIRHSIEGSPTEFLSDYKNPCWVSSLDDPDPYSSNHYRDRKEYFNSVQWSADSSLQNASEVFRPEVGGWRVRCLPYVYLLGVTKSGTTDLYSQLLKHPEVEAGAIKEPMWWNRKRLGVGPPSGIPFPFSDYLDLYDFAAHIINSTVQIKDGRLFHPKVTVDASTTYLWDYDGWNGIPGHIGHSEPQQDLTVASTLRKVIPQAKLVVMLREPLDRLYSHFRMWWPDATQMEFQKESLAAVDLMEDCRKSRSVRSCAYDAVLNRREARIPGRVYLRASLYDVFLADWLAAFPRDQLLVIQAEEYFQNRSRTLQEVFSFLGLPPLRHDKLAQIAHSDVIHRRTAKSHLAHLPILNKTRTILTEFFKPHNENLASMLNDRKFLWL